MQLDILHTLIQTLKGHSEVHADRLKRSEALTRSALIDPFLRELGWDTGNPSQVIPEYQSGNGRADYALLHDDKPIIMIEAKPLGSNIHDSALIQGITYCVSTGTPYFAVTDGIRWEVYEAFKQVATDEKILVKFDFSSMAIPDAVLKSLVFWRLNVQSGPLETAQVPIVNHPPEVVTLPKVSNGSQEHPINENTVLPLISRDQLKAFTDGDVGLYPSRPDGVEFLTTNHAWGFIKIKRIPKYFAIYIGSPIFEIQYIGEVEGVIDPALEGSPVSTQHSSYQPGKKVITFKEGRLWKLAEPVKYGKLGRGKAPQGLQFHPLTKIANAVTLDDLRA